MWGLKTVHTGRNKAAASLFRGNQVQSYPILVFWKNLDYLQIALSLSFDSRWKEGCCTGEDKRIFYGEPEARIPTLLGSGSKMRWTGCRRPSLNWGFGKIMRIWSKDLTLVRFMSIWHKLWNEWEKGSSIEKCLIDGAEGKPVRHFLKGWSMW